MQEISNPPTYYSTTPTALEVSVATQAISSAVIGVARAVSYVMVELERLAAETHILIMFYDEWNKEMRSRVRVIARGKAKKDAIAWAKRLGLDDDTIAELESM